MNTNTTIEIVLSKYNASLALLAADILHIPVESVIKLCLQGSTNLLAVKAIAK